MIGDPLSIPAEVPTVDDIRRNCAAQRADHDLSSSGLSKAITQVRDRPLSAVLIALVIGLIGGYLVRR